MFDMSVADWFVLIVAFIVLFLMARASFDKQRTGGTSADDIDPINFDDYDEDIGFEITIDGKIRVFSEASTIWVNSGSEIRLRTKVEPEDMNGDLDFENLPSNHRCEWNYDCFDGLTIADLEIDYNDGDEDSTRVVRVDPSVEGSVTIDCMIIDDSNGSRYVASVALVFTPEEVPVPESKDNLPLVQLEQA